MQGRADGQTPAERIPQPRDEIISSIQLIPEEQGAGSNEGTPFRRDKRGGCLVSINNFIQKTYAILQEKQFESIVSWPDEGEVTDEGQGSSFLIHNVRAFEEIVLPRYFKHSNMSSFVRQVPLYSSSSTCTASTKCGETKIKSSFSMTSSSGTVLISSPKLGANRSTPPRVSPLSL
jgi:hypothetical protein